MRTLRIRLELNKGRKGIPPYKLAAITEEVQRFFQRVSSDLGINAPKDKWLAVRFRDGSVSFDCEYQGRIAQHRVEAYNEELANLITLGGDGDGPIVSRLSQGTIHQFTKIAEPIDEGEKIRLGLYRNGAKRPKWAVVTKTLCREIADRISNVLKYRGSAQGIVHSWFKEAAPPYFNLRELTSGRILKCFYPKDAYAQIVELFQKKNAVLTVIGLVTANMIDRQIEEVEAEKFHIAEEMSDEEFEHFFGSIPDLTGDLTTEEYVSAVRYAE